MQTYHSDGKIETAKRGGKYISTFKRKRKRTRYDYVYLVAGMNF